ncbi:MAG: 30S ribosome-binding factor RbfA [Bacteroidales bacterium]|nr:30S ribosome-binding factor RbfA [Bacteroidales bacterium]
MDNKPAGTRQLKVAREIQRDLAEIIRSRGMAAFGGAMVTVSEVRMSPDLSIAKTYVSIFPSDRQAEVMKLLEENKKQLRGELGRKVASQLRIVPEIDFYLDTSLDYAERIDELLRK